MGTCISCSHFFLPVDQTYDLNMRYLFKLTVMISFICSDIQVYYIYIYIYIYIYNILYIYIIYICIYILLYILLLY